MNDRFQNADFAYYDKAIRDQVEIIASLLTVSAQNNIDAKKAVSTLEKLRMRLIEDVSTMSDNVHATVAHVAEGTATKAAELLQKKFTEADAAADAAARRYLQAGRWLGIKTFLVLLACLGAMVLGGWLIAAPLLPTFEELQKRRDEISTLTALAQDLENKGVKLVWRYCLDRNKSKVMCFRTDGETYTDHESGATYASPYRAKS